MYIQIKKNVYAIWNTIMLQICDFKIQTTYNVSYKWESCYQDRVYFSKKCILLENKMNPLRGIF
jgi:hypothetical protein